MNFSIGLLSAIIIIILFSSLSTGMISHCFFKLASKIDYNKKKLFINVGIITILNSINQFIYVCYPKLNSIKPFLSLITIILIGNLIYNLSLLKTVLCSISCMILSALAEILSCGILILLGYNMADITSRPLGYCLSSSLCNVFLLLFLFLIYRITNSKKSSLGILNLDNHKYLVYQLIVILICLLPTIYLLFFTKYDYPVMFIFANTLQLIFASCFGLIYTRKRIIHRETEEELNNTKLHNEALSLINENVRGFKHDMGNIVQAFNGYIATNNIDGMRDYCNTLLKGFNDINILTILSPKIINDPGIYGIVVGKILLARENELNLSIDIGCDVSSINFPKFELSRMLGILLDNAIEACIKSKDKKLTLNMYFDNIKKEDMIVIGNSVEDPSKIDIVKMFEKNYSTKEKPSGFGLYEVMKFLRKYKTGDIIPNVDYEKNMFTQTLIFEKENK